MADRKKTVMEISKWDRDVSDAMREQFIEGRRKAFAEAIDYLYEPCEDGEQCVVCGRLRAFEITLEDGGTTYETTYHSPDVCRVAKIEARAKGE